MKIKSWMGAFYLGFAIAAFGNISFLMWEWWAICVPTIVLLKKRYFQER